MASNEAVMELSPSQQRRAEVLEQIHFHEKYLHCSLSISEDVDEVVLQTRPAIKDKDYLVINQVNVLFPGELQPVVVSRSDSLSVHESDAFILIVSNDTVLCEGTLAKIVARGESESDVIFLVRGEQRVRCERKSSNIGMLHSFVPDAPIIYPNRGRAGKEYIETLIREEEKLGSFSKAAEMAFSEDVRQRFFACRNPLARRVFIRKVESLASCPLLCKHCMKDGVRTVLAADARRLRSLVICANPGGFTFVMLLYNTDCVSTYAADIGYYTSQYSWFSEYRWRYTMCRVCANHLGWKYASRNASLLPFWGFRSSEVVNCEDLPVGVLENELGKQDA